MVKRYRSTQAVRFTRYYMVPLRRRARWPLEFAAAAAFMFALLCIFMLAADWTAWALYMARAG